MPCKLPLVASNGRINRLARQFYKCIEEGRGEGEGGRDSLIDLVKKGL